MEGCMKERRAGNGGRSVVFILFMIGTWDGEYRSTGGVQPRPTWQHPHWQRRLQSPASLVR